MPPHSVFAAGVSYLVLGGRSVKLASRKTAFPKEASNFPHPRSDLHPNGFTYERSAIERWFENHDTDPETGATLESKALIPNRRLRSMIREFQERQRAAQG